MALSLNKQKEKKWNDIIKRQSIANGWKFKGWFAYKAIDGFFFEVNFFLAGKTNSIDGSLQFKPLQIDDTFWEIIDLNENKKLPLSFRGSGAFVVRSKDVFDFQLKITGDTLQKDIDNLFGTINNKTDELSSAITSVDSFEQYVERFPNQKSEWFDVDLLIVAYISQKKFDMALSLLDYAKKTRGMCSWNFGDKNFGNDILIQPTVLLEINQL